MGTGFVDRESEQAEHWAVFLIVLGIIAHIFTKYAIINIDMITFAIIVFTFFTACMLVKTAKDIIISIECRKQAAYEVLKSKMSINKNFEVKPLCFKSGSKFSKYATVASGQVIKKAV